MLNCSLSRVANTLALVLITGLLIGCDSKNTSDNAEITDPEETLQTESPLYKYVKTSDGTYEYDVNTPVDRYRDANQFIEIPDRFIPQKQAFRSAWVATIANLNMPLAGDEADFKQKYMKILDRFSALNMNAMIFQIRPMLDAYYKSALNPWSQFLSGRQGQDPGYDPLVWMIAQTHQRGMEYHAWFNPYRVTNAKITSLLKNSEPELSAEQILALTVEQQISQLVKAGILAEENFAARHPQWVLIFDEKLILNPAVPEVVEYIADTVREVIENYDVDAIHFDDYFYPYRISVNGVNVLFGNKGEDRAEFEEYGLVTGEYLDSKEGIEQWRRDNITRLIATVQEVITEHNQEQGASVQLGISPFGIWEHQENHELGSHTPVSSSQSYSSSIYADTRHWIKEELIDYVIPQIYWSFDQTAAPYGELAHWWNDAVENTRVQLYVGHANYKHAANGGFDAAWMNPEELPNQLRYNQKLSQVSGSAFFSYNDLLLSDIGSLPVAQQAAHGAKNQAIALLSERYFNAPALVPAKPWLGHGVTTSPLQAHFVKGSEDSFTWTDTADNNARYYVIYRGTGTADKIFADPQNIIARIWRGEREHFSYRDSRSEGRRYTYLISALDAAQNETPAIEVTNAH